MSPKIISSLFVALIFGLPLGQAGWEYANGEEIQALEVFGPVNETRLRAFEDDLRAASFMHREVTPWYQLALLKLFGRGNEKTIVGNDGWLFFGENLDYMTRPNFGRTGEQAIRATMEDFGAQLAEQGIALIVVPAPAKVAEQPANLSRWTKGLGQVEHAETKALFASLEHASVWKGPVDAAGGIRFDYLARDTHWTPQCMESSAKSVAQLASSVLAERKQALTQRTQWGVRPRQLTGDGDLAGLLRLPEGVQAFEPMDLALHEVFDAASGDPFAPARHAEVLLLGDSFTQVFSDARLEMGEHAGFAEHLAKELGAPLDVIALAGGSARAVRESLARRPEGLSGKKLVIWQVSVRDFIGDPSMWEKVRMPVASATKGAPSGPFQVRAELVALTRIPEEFSYEFCLAVHEYKVVQVLSGTPPPGNLWVAHVAYDHFKATPQAAYEVGELHTFVLDDVALYHDLESTSWLDDTGADPRSTIWFPTTMEIAEQRRQARAEAELRNRSTTEPGRPVASKSPKTDGPSVGLQLARARSAAALRQRISQVERFGYSQELAEVCSRLLDLNPGQGWFPSEGWSPARNELVFVRALNPAAPIAGSEPPAGRDQMQVMLQYHQELQAHGIDLLIVPIPGRVQFWSDRMLGVVAEDPIHGGDVGLPRLLLEMTEAGLNVVDVYPALACARAQARAEGESEPDLYLTHNTHWAPTGIEVCAAPIVEWIRATDWFEQGPAVEGLHFFQRREVEVDDTIMYGPQRPAPPARLFPRVVSRAGNRPYKLDTPIARNSPVLLIGDSFASFYAAEQADIGLQIFAQIGIPVDVISLQQGGEAAVWKSVARRQDNLAGKKLVIWLFSVNVLTSPEVSKVQIFND